MAVIPVQQKPDIPELERFIRRRALEVLEACIDKTAPLSEYEQGYFRAVRQVLEFLGHPIGPLPSERGPLTRFAETIGAMPTTVTRWESTSE